jgi:hypothetical protein
MSTPSARSRKNLRPKKRSTRKALKRGEYLSRLLDDLLSSKEKTRYRSFRILLNLSEKQPRVLYPTWDFFVGLLTSESPTRQYIAIHILARLTRVDSDKRFEKIFDEYYGLLDDPSVIPAAHVAGHSGMIAAAKPHLQTRITNALLSTDETHHASHRKELIKAYALRSFGEYIGQAKRKKPIIEFARRQTKSESPSARKTARQFLKQWGP